MPTEPRKIFNFLKLLFYSWKHQQSIQLTVYYIGCFVDLPKPVFLTARTLKSRFSANFGTFWTKKFRMTDFENKSAYAPPKNRFKNSRTIRQNFCKNYFFSFWPYDGNAAILWLVKKFGGILNWGELWFLATTPIATTAFTSARDFTSPGCPRLSRA